MIPLVADSRWRKNSTHSPEKSNRTTGNSEPQQAAAAVPAMRTGNSDKPPATIKNNVKSRSQFCCPVLSLSVLTSEATNNTMPAPVSAASSTASASGKAENSHTRWNIGIYTFSIQPECHANTK